MVQERWRRGPFLIPSPSEFSATSCNPCRWEHPVVSCFAVKPASRQRPWMDSFCISVSIAYQLMRDAAGRGFYRPLSGICRREAPPGPGGRSCCGPRWLFDRYHLPVRPSLEHLPCFNPNGALSFVFCTPELPLLSLTSPRLRLLCRHVDSQG